MVRFRKAVFRSGDAPAWSRSPATTRRRWRKRLIGSMKHGIRQPEKTEYPKQGPKLIDILAPHFFLAEVAAAIFALWKKLFDLSAESEVVTAKKVIEEIMDGLESNGVISEELANNLRSQYSGILGETDTSIVRNSPSLKRVR